MQAIRVTAGAALLVLVGACGVPVQSEPIAVPGAALPPDAEIAEPTPAEPARPVVAIFLVRTNRLSRLERHVPVPTLHAALFELFQGPVRDEAGGGLRSAIPPAARVRAATAGGPVATVDVSVPFLDVTGEEQILAVAQLVFTATAIDGVDAVQVLIGGERVEVPRGDGTLTPGPLYPADYRAQAPLP